MAVEPVRTEFDALMEEVRADLVQMGAMVSEGISAVTSALLAGDIAAADQIVAADDELDLLSLEAEDKCVRLFALQQPVATDLRAGLTDLRLIGEIERSGDLVTNIAKAISRIGGIQFTPAQRGVLARMRDQAVSLMSKAIGAYADRDAGVAAVIDELDDVLDELQNELLGEIIVSCNDGDQTVQQAVQLAAVGRFYERIGDHAVNISERVLFLVTGEMPEHAGAERARARRQSTATDQLA